MNITCLDDVRREVVVRLTIRVRELAELARKRAFGTANFATDLWAYEHRAVDEVCRELAELLVAVGGVVPDNLAADLVDARKDAGDTVPCPCCGADVERPNAACPAHGIGRISDDRPKRRY